MNDATIRPILLAKGYRPYTLSADLGVSRKVAKRLLHGTQDLNFGDLTLLTDKLDVSIGFLLGEPGELAARAQRKAEPPKPKEFEPYSFVHTCGGHNLMATVGTRSETFREAQEAYTRYLGDWRGELTKDDIESESMRIAKTYLGEDFLERTLERRRERGTAV